MMADHIFRELIKPITQKVEELEYQYEVHAGRNGTYNYVAIWEGYKNHFELYYNQYKGMFLVKGAILR